MLTKFSLLLLLILAGCTCTPKTPEYRDQYLHLKSHKPTTSNSCADYFVLFLVDARHLDYSNGAALLKTLVKHPSDGSKNSDVGHAWILLYGKTGSRTLIIEGGHSGESGLNEPRYFDGMMNYIEYGYSNPTEEQKYVSRYEPNPIKFLSEKRQDGYFERGSGRHRPTYAIKVNLTAQQFHSILSYTDPAHYEFCHYSLDESQCCSFVANVARIAGLELQGEVSVPIPQKIKVGSESLVLWEDPYYSLLSFFTPDILEKEMIRAVEEGRAEYALPLYLRNWKKRRCLCCHWRMFRETLSLFPARYNRVQMF